MNLLTYTGPTTTDPVTLGFRQAIGATDVLRAGTYSKTLTFTLSTTTAVVLRGVDRPGLRPRAAGGRGRYRICTPEIARLMTSRWISEVPSKIV